MLDFIYYPHWQNDSLKLTEFRMQNHDTIYKRTETISWIVGSGQHTNSHLLNFNGYVYQAPATYYTQKGTWDLPPGFENGYNSRFSRMIGLECMSCHNAFPKMVIGSENKYDFIANGIDCERCHGPGEKHVQQKLAGKILDVSSQTDYTIVNPAKLPIARQLDICQRCHIQGNAVLKEGKSFFDFRPAMRLSDVMDIYMPVFKGGENEHIMASHAERMKLSQCFKVSIAKAEELNKVRPSLTPYKNAMTCITCHDPHVSVRSTDQAIFNAKCMNCHNRTIERAPDEQNESMGCKESIAKRSIVNDNCVSCHMPSSGTIDIPHVITTDHWIRIPGKTSDVGRIKEFAGLACINNPDADYRSKAKAFISYYEKFSSNLAYLDSAEKYIKGADFVNDVSNFKIRVHILYLKRNYMELIALVNAIPGALSYLSQQSFTNDDAWTAYRIGEAFLQEANLKRSLEFLGRAVELAPFHPDFRNKLAGAYVDAGLNDKAKENYQFILSENPHYFSAYINLGYLIMKTSRDIKLADSLYNKALSLDPDNIQALLNKSGLLIYQGKRREARELLFRVLKRERGNAQATMLLKEIS